MATTKKKATKKTSRKGGPTTLGRGDVRKGRTARAYRFSRSDQTTARARKAARKATRKSPLRGTLARGEQRPSRKPARKASPARRRAPLIPPHAPSPRPGRPCKVCGLPHTRRAHGSHAKGKKIPFSYKTRREGIFARAVKGIRKMAAKKPAARKRAARRGAT